MIWSNYRDLTRPHPKWWFSKENPRLFQGNHPVGEILFHLARMISRVDYSLTWSNLDCLWTRRLGRFGDELKSDYCSTGLKSPPKIDRLPSVLFVVCRGERFSMNRWVSIMLFYTASN